MGHESKIVVGVDGSAQSLRALDWAMQEAVARERELVLVCAYTVPAFSATTLDGGFAALNDAAIRAGAEQVLVASAVHAETAGVTVSTELAVGDASGVLVAASKTADLVVVGSRGRGGFAGRLLGAVSSALPAHASCPTVVVPLRETQDGATVPVKRIVVGVDGSPSSELALRHAVVEAEMWQAELVAVAGVPVAQMTGVLAWLPSAVDTEKVLRDHETSVSQMLDRVLEGHDLRVRRIVLDGTGAELLTEFSSAADLIVVGSRGRGGFAGLLLGSTSQAVLHHSQCPVMIINSRNTLADETPPDE
ncbi:MAG: universal stress protein [Micrococcales bacterium]|nr:universal stress protein [Micrococcales bacterium]